ncbi:MAG: ECF-type sigma factor [Phycisphaerales bacterium]
MTLPDQRTITAILADLADGDRDAARELLPHVYEELHRVAAALLRDQRPGHTLQPTALVHEAYLRLDGRDDVRARGRGEFFALAARVMRHLLVDHARERNAAKRGGGWQRVTLQGIGGSGAGQSPPDVLDLEAALVRLEALNPDDARLVELRFFGGLTGEEAGLAIGDSRNSAARRWRRVRAWLKNELAEPE